MQSNDVMIGTSTLDFPSRSDKEAVTVPTVATSGGDKKNAEISAATTTSELDNNSASRTSAEVPDPTSEARETVATSNGSQMKGLDMFTFTFATLTGVVLLQSLQVVRRL